MKIHFPKIYQGVAHVFSSSRKKTPPNESFYGFSDLGFGVLGFGLLGFDFLGYDLIGFSILAF